MLFENYVIIDFRYKQWYNFIVIVLKELEGFVKKKNLLIFCLCLFAIILLTFSVILVVNAIKDSIEEKQKQALIKQYYADKLALYTQENNTYQDYEVDVAFLGDSLTDGYDVSSYYSEFVVSNRGIGGETTVGLERR